MCLSTSCVHCHMGIEWVDCPTGGWWSHFIHPDNGHDAEAWFEVISEMDDSGYYGTDYLDTLRSLGDQIYRAEVFIPEPPKSPPELKLDPLTGHLREV